MAEDVAGAFELTSEFTQLRGSATDTFRFDLTLESSSPRQASFSLAAVGPDDWTVTARPSAQQQASTVTVEPGATATIQVEANPPDDVEAGTYPIVVRAEAKSTSICSRETWPREAAWISLRTVRIEAPSRSWGNGHRSRIARGVALWRLLNCPMNSGHARSSRPCKRFL